MTLSISDTMKGSGYNGWSGATWTTLTGDILVAFAHMKSGAGAYGDWNSVQLSTTLTYDASTGWDGNDYLANLEDDPYIGTAVINGPGSKVAVGMAARISGGSGTYNHLYHNPAANNGAISCSVSCDSGWKALFFCHRVKYGCGVSIVSGGENLTLEKSSYWAAWNYANHYLYSMDCNATTLQVSATGYFGHLIAFEPSGAGDVFLPIQVSGFF